VVVGAVICNSGDKESGEEEDDG
jgi:hypothetical protein